jgi:hypothetical protein
MKKIRSKNTNATRLKYMFDLLHQLLDSVEEFEGKKKQTTKQKKHTHTK